MTQAEFNSTSFATGTLINYDDQLCIVSRRKKLNFKSLGLTQGDLGEAIDFGGFRLIPIVC